MDFVDNSASTDIPVTQKFMKDMDDYLSGKVQNDQGNIFTVLSNIAYDKKMEDIEFLEKKHVDEFPIKVLTVPHLVHFLRHSNLPIC
jgi:hypothetical protein